MLLPNAGRAVIPAEKLRDYLLNPQHRQNRGKARLFAALGYTQADWQRPERDIREQHLTQDAVEVAPNAHGTRWQIDALLRGPLGEARIRTGWSIRRGTPDFRPPIESEMLRPKLLSCVALKVDLPEFHLRAGDSGVVVEVYPRDDVEVEFMDDSGETVALLTVSDRLLREVPDSEELQYAAPLPDGAEVATGNATVRVQT